ncbi:MAG: N-acetylmannosamine-6-phosphate 2-epimerase [Leptolyngbyaceae bacterium]|nr:N-acetylmannosamine-6-phosphate 2-epimerase [Leptolyngbyaceae bacterium]
MIPTAIARLKHGLVVSCQAPAQSPLHEPSIIAAIAQAAVLNGAVGVRIDSPDHVKAVRERVDAPIIGLWKQQFPDSDVYITPQFHHAEAIAAAGADIIAIDATSRRRPKDEQLESLIQQIHTQLGKPVMADIDTLESAIAAAEAGADIVGTTLYGYTRETGDRQPPGLDLLSAMAETLTVPLVCEGGIASPEMMNAAFAQGAYTVVVGTAITGIDLQVQAYVRAISSVSARL